MCDNLPFLQSEKDWRCAKYGPLGLIETLLKCGGMLVMLASIGEYDPQVRCCAERSPRSLVPACASVAPAARRPHFAFFFLYFCWFFFLSSLFVFAFWVS